MTDRKRKPHGQIYDKECSIQLQERAIPNTAIYILKCSIVLCSQFYLL